MTKPTSEQVTFLAAGSGASQRTVLDKLRDVVSVKDFGAVGDGVADDTAAFNNAVTAAGTRNVFVPGGSYKITGTVTGSFYSDATVTIVTGTVNTINRIGSVLSTTGALTVGGDIAVNGSDITTTSAGTATVFNTNATTLNLGGAATTVALGATNGTVSVGNLSMDAGYGSIAPVYGCRAWVNFNGTGAVTIRASGNVSSITDNGVGQYTVNFTNPMSDSNYAVVGMGMLNRRVQYQSATFGAGIQTTGSVAILNTDSATTAQDDQCINIVIFR